MTKFILARKGAMSRIFQADGTAVAVTKIMAEPCLITQIKTTETDGYQAVQLASGTRRKTTKPLLGHSKAAGGAGFQFIKEFKVPASDYKVGQKIEVTAFQPGDKVAATGWSKGRGFQGVVKRHHFHGHPTSHGHKDQARMPGSIGAGGVQHVRKGMRMAGRMGNEQVTVHNLEVIKVDSQNHELLLKGAVPGAYRGLILIKAQN
ncbi:MAG: 50S ribosomal protein L3 [Candidatus Kerfeldbacteria bacterium]|nr:50S ribosomal protein L3 [Candidatus Kerfeldbacteria bacterium]